MRQVLLLALMIPIVLTFTACGTVADKVERISEEFNNADKVLLTADICADYGDRCYSFKITCNWTADECSIEIKEPESIKGIRAICMDDGYELQYEGAVITTGELTENGVSPANVLPFLLEQWGNGFVTGAVKELYEEISAVAVETRISDTLLQKTWFDTDGLLPIYSEIWENGTAVITCAFENIVLE